MGFLEEAKKMQQEAEQNSIQNKTNIELLERLEQVGNIQDRKIQQEELIQELHRRAVENIKISEMERIKINKNNFADKDEVIDILLYAVSKMAMDTTFYDINIAKLTDHKPLYRRSTE